MRDLEFSLQVGPDWKLMDETDGKKRKYGYISNVVGSVILLKAEFCGGGCPVPDVGGPYVNLIYLQSWSGGMGQARVTCVGRCTCIETTFDGHNSANKASIAKLGTIKLRPTNDTNCVHAGGENVCPKVCVLHVTIVSTTSTGGHKFKIIGLATGTGDIEDYSYYVHDIMGGRGQFG